MCEIRLRLVAVVRPGRKRHPELTMDDSDSERPRRPETFNGEDTGWRDWSRVLRTWAGRFQRGRVQEIIRISGEMRLHWLNWIFDSRIGRVPG